jgi:hypothetical protein
MPRRSRRSHVVEFVLSAIALLAIYLFLTNGGPELVGTWMAGQFRP